jgi:hypothetical protein
MLMEGRVDQAGEVVVEVAAAPEEVDRPMEAMGATALMDEADRMDLRGGAGALPSPMIRKPSLSWE